MPSDSAVLVPFGAQSRDRSATLSLHVVLACRLGALHRLGSATVLSGAVRRRLPRLRRKCACTSTRRACCTTGSRASLHASQSAPKLALCAQPNQESHFSTHRRGRSHLALWHRCGRSHLALWHRCRYALDLRMRESKLHAAMDRMLIARYGHEYPCVRTQGCARLWGTRGW